MIIRMVDDADWPAIWPIVEQVVAAGETYAYPEPLDPETARSYWLEPPPGRAVVAVDEDPAATILGTAKMGPNRPGRGAHVATASFMVDAAAQGRGVGRALGEYAVDWARSAGYHGMQFNAVVEANTVAVALWKSLGFQIIGTVPQAYDHRRLGLVGLHVMYLPLAP